MEINKVDYICYICKKVIGKKPFYSIGKNNKGIELYRHKRCNPNRLSKKESEERKNWSK